MKKWIVILSVVLSVQLGLAIALDISGTRYGAFEPKEKLLVFETETVDSLHIETDEQRIALSKQDGNWTLPESDGFPANQSAVKGLLEKLAALQKGWPVATTTSAAARFKVSDGDFERKLILLSNGKAVATLYVGTSPGLRKVHMRSDGSDDIYAVAFNTWEVNAKTDEWIDKEILKLNEKLVKRIELPGIVLQREDGALQLLGRNDMEETNEKEASNLAQKLTDLRIDSLLGSKAKTDYQQEKPSLEIKLTLDNGDELTYRFSKPKDGAYYVLKRSDLAYYFKVAEFEVSPIKDKTRDKLVQLKTEKPGKENDEQVTTSAANKTNEGG